MNKLILRGLLLLYAQVVWGADFTLGEHGSVSVRVPETWRVENKPSQSERIVQQSFTISPTNGRNAVVSVVVVYGKKADYDRSSAENLTREMAEKYREKDPGAFVEKTVNLTELKSSSGFGFYVTSTDAELVGKPPIKKNFKTISHGIICLSPEVRIAVMIYADSVTDSTFMEMLEILGSASFRKAK